jgi:hypothetical protein
MLSTCRDEIIQDFSGAANKYFNEYPDPALQRGKLRKGSQLIGELSV